MKKELPPATLWVAVGVGVLVIGGVAWSIFGSGTTMTKDEQTIAAKEAEIARQRSEGYARGSSAPGSAPAGPAGSGTGEYAARQAAGGGQ